MKKPISLALSFIVAIGVMALEGSEEVKPSHIWADDTGFIKEGVVSTPYSEDRISSLFSNEYICTTSEEVGIEEVGTEGVLAEKSDVVDGGTESVTTEWWEGLEGLTLNAIDGVTKGPSGKETYYNMEMQGVVQIMRDCGFSEEDYPYWVREDGVKMLGNYVMVAADLSIRPRGSLIECSLGKAIVCDTGDFIYENPYQLDIAVNW